jgi:hypothetical protein
MITLQAHALNRVVRCNGSHWQEPSEVPPDMDQSDDQREGIAAHWVAMEVIAGRALDAIEFVDRKAQNGVFVTVDMVEAIDPFIQDVLSRGATPHIESNVDFQLSDAVRILCRLDLATYEFATGTLTVDDYKHGYRIIEPVDNWQLVAGAMGWIIKHQIKPNRIDLNIHQPRPHHPDGKKRSWEFESYEKFEQAYMRMAWALHEVTTDTFSGDHCYKCPALANCTAARRAGYNAIDIAGQAFNDKLTNAELSNELLTVRRGKAAIEQVEKAYEELLTYRINSGQVVRDWFIEPTYANTRFKKGVTPDMLKMLSGINPAITKMPTPGQVKKLGISEQIVDAFTERPMTGTKLVHKSASQIAGKMFKPPTKD